LLRPFIDKAGEESERGAVGFDNIDEDRIMGGKRLLHGGLHHMVGDEQLLVPVEDAVNLDADVLRIHFSASRDGMDLS
jgi:hypothetical protein